MTPKSIKAHMNGVRETLPGLPSSGPKFYLVSLLFLLALAARSGFSFSSCVFVPLVAVLLCVPRALSVSSLVFAVVVVRRSVCFSLPPLAPRRNKKMSRRLDILFNPPPRPKKTCLSLSRVTWGLPLRVAHTHSTSCAALAVWFVSRTGPAGRCGREVCVRVQYPRNPSLLHHVWCRSSSS